MKKSCFFVVYNRSSSEDNEETGDDIHPTKFFDHPPIVGASLFDYIRNWFFANLIVKPTYDQDFSLKTFTKGAEQVGLFKFYLLLRLLLFLYYV